VEEQDDRRAGLEFAQELAEYDRDMVPDLVEEDAEAGCIGDLLTAKSLCQYEVAERIIGEKMAW